MLGGLVSARLGAARVAIVFLAVSAACCLLSPFVLGVASPVVTGVFLIVWDVAVVGDSPQFSTLAAQASSVAVAGAPLAACGATPHEV